MVGFAGSAMPDLRFLAPQIPLVIWDEAETDQRTALAVNCGGTDVSAPVLRLNAQLESGGWRCFLAFATPAGSDGRLVLKDAHEAVLFAADAPFLERDQDTLGSLDLGYMLSGLTDAGRVRLIRFLLHSCRTAFGLSGDATYASNMTRFADELSLQPGSLMPCAFLTRNLVLMSGKTPVSIGLDAKVLVISDDSVEESPVAPFIDTDAGPGEKDRQLLVPIDKSALAKDACIVLTGAAGVAIRRVKTDGHKVEPIVTWLANHKHDAGFYRDYAVQCLTHLGQIDPTAVSAVREIFALRQSPAVGASGNADLQFMPDRAVAAGENLFISGRFSDPHDLIRSVNIRVGDWSTAIDRQTLAAHSASEARADATINDQSVSFVALAAGPCQPPAFGMVQITVQLKSGAVIDGQHLELIDCGRNARQRILSALPATAITDRQVDEVFAPALRAISDSGPGPASPASDVTTIGPRLQYEGASILIPLNRDASVVTTWISAIAAGVVNGLQNELIFVQPAAADLALTERTLGNLHRRFGVCTKLVTMDADLSSHDQVNAAAATATCDRLVLLGETCFPSAENTLHTLLSVLDDGGVGLAGGAVVDPNGTIIHAGFAAPADEYMATPYAGFPAIELMRVAQRRVFACSSDFLALHRTAFEELDGYSQTYFTRAWGDADFSRRLCQSGKSVCFEHRARAIRFQVADRALQTEISLARRIDCRRFMNEWSDDLAGWSQGVKATDEADSPNVLGSASVRAGNARWAA